MLFPFIDDKLNIYNLFFKLLATITLLFILVNLRKIQYKPDVCKYLSAGFFTLLLTVINSTLNELFIQPWLLATLLMDIGHLIGLVLILYGLNIWAEQNTTHSFKLKKLSETDQLTGLYTRRHFDQQLTTILSTPSDELKFSILLINIDNFKSVNKQYTQAAGDFVLQRFANKLKDFVRQTDVIARWGGEEFIILLRNSNNTIAKQVAEAIRTKTELLCIEYNQGIINFTVSIGAASYESELKDDQVIDRAEKCLLAAKIAGKNQVNVER